MQSREDVCVFVCPIKGAEGGGGCALADEVSEVS